MPAPGVRATLRSVPGFLVDTLSHSGTTKGFTGHEMLDEVGIIHMNGRIYDARLGRFLQADPFIDGAYNTQGVNRYAYGKNNPLNGTDPSGYFFKKLVKIAIAAALTYFTAGFACYDQCSNDRRYSFCHC